jgi:hypothetical protein
VDLAVSQNLEEGQQNNARKEWTREECNRKYFQAMDAREFQALATAHRKLAAKSKKRPVSPLVPSHENRTAIPNEDGGPKATLVESADKYNNENSQVLWEALTEEDTLAVNDLLQARKMVKLNHPVLTNPQITKGGNKGYKGSSSVHERSQSSLLLFWQAAGRGTNMK